MIPIQRGEAAGGAYLFDNNGSPGQSRTADLRFRKPLLYPSELQGHKDLRHQLSIIHRIAHKASHYWIFPSVPFSIPSRASSWGGACSIAATAFVFGLSRTLV